MQPHARHGFTAWELLIVTVLTLIIAGMLVPAMSMGHRESRGHNCGSNQRQIVLAMNVYANDNDQHWPVYTAAATGALVAVDDPAFDATATAIASFEFLTAVTGGDLNAKVFACPSYPTVRPTNAVGDFTDAGPHFSAWAAQGPEHIGYAYDWSAPANAAGVRVMTADRHTTVHKNVVMAAYADGHVGSLNRSGSSSVFINRDAKDDDIYSATGDGPMALPGDGSTTRAFVR